jgi:two-component system LytT family response regulator
MIAPGLRAVNVDDEVLARLAIRQALGCHADVEVVGECGDGAEALAAIPRLHPDVMFIDVQMPGMDGFELLERLQRLAHGKPLVIFATAFDQHALAAFEAEAMDYLLKPFEQARFDQALARVRIQARGRSSMAASVREPVERLCVRDGVRIHLVRLDEIDWIEAQGNYVAVHTRNATLLHRETLTSLTARLDARRFLRIHRSTLVNLDRVTAIEPRFYGDARVVLGNGVKLALSRRYRDQARTRLGL